ncbi:MAG TPA: phosphate ABC transporter substrate-binding protein, partial [Myxococcaceae bacterium]
YFYLGNKPAGEVKAFIDFALSPEGQAVVTKVGYFPVK